ncbi:MAG: ribonuclease Y [Candidatus Marinimicrobia bacterium]|nr:ribonuclease Y [Candidatus Neomarinimicrobiota bacterium]
MWSGNMIGNILFGIAGLIIGAIASIFIYISILKRSKSTAGEIIEGAKKEAADIIKEAKIEAKDEAYRIKQKAEEEYRAKLKETRELEKQLVKREFELDKKLEVAQRKLEDIEQKEKQIDQREKRLTEEEKRIHEIIEMQNEKLEKIAGLSRNEAKELLMNNLLEEAKRTVANQVREIKERAITDANREARNIIINAIQRSAADHTAETTVTVVNLPNDTMKGRIIGREGRNIRHFEALTGVEIIVDDTPEAVVLSGFDPIRREIARIALEKLVQDGRIHPARIEEAVEKAREEVDESILHAAEEAIDEVGLPPFHPEMMKLIGRLKYRTSYGQNVLKHSIEVAWLSGLMASELRLNGELAKRAGFLHDLGKAIDRNVTGTHAMIGADLAKKYGEEQIIVNAIASHHEEVEMESPYAVLVQAADAISGSRRGARGDTLENYIQRLEKLEEIAKSFEGVSKTYAIQAGREVRVIVENEIVDDVGADNLAEEIASKIQRELNYPGHVKVVVVREHRSISYAK